VPTASATLPQRRTICTIPTPLPRNRSDYFPDDAPQQRARDFTTNPREACNLDAEPIERSVYVLFPNTELTI
jgi:hypothetical protein